MTMTPGLRKFALTVHIMFSVGWIGAVAAYIALDVTTVTSQDVQTLRAAYLAMELTVRFVIAPLAIASLLTGLVMSLGTPWGLFRHYWVLISLLLTILATVVLLVETRTISYLADTAADLATSSDDLRALGSTLVHSVGGTVILLVILWLNVYKPRGLTPYGWRKQHERRQVSPPIPPQRLTTMGNKGDTHMADLPSQPNANNDTGVEPDHGSTTGTPWRLYVLLGSIGLVFLLFIVLHLTGGGLAGLHTP